MPSVKDQFRRRQTQPFRADVRISFTLNPIRILFILACATLGGLLAQAAFEYLFGL